MNKIFPVVLTGALFSVLTLPASAADDGCGLFTTDDCNQAAVGADNVVRNSSFETGIDGWGIMRGEPLQGVGSTSAPTTPTYSAPALDTTTSTHGSTSLRIDNPNAGSWRLMSREFAVEPGQQYVLSLDSKAAQQVQVNVNIEFDDGTLVSSGGSFQPQFGAGAAWQRFTLPAITIPAGRRHANIHFEYGIYDPVLLNSTLWLDAIQFRKVPNTAYTPRPIDLGLTGGRPYTTAATDNFPMTLKVRNNAGASTTTRIHYGVIDEYFKKVVSQGDIANFSVGANATVTQNLTNISPKKRGKYIFSAQVIRNSDGKVMDRSQFDFAVIDSVKKGANQFTDDFTVSDTIMQQGNGPMGPGGDSRDIYSLFGGSADDFFDFRAEAGDRWIRCWDFSWSHVEPTNGTYNWTLLDNVVNKAAARGIRIMPCLGNEFIDDNNTDIPTWIPYTSKPRTVGGGTVHLPNIDTTNTTTEQNSYWARYIRACVNRYKDRINTWEVLNEPQLWMSADDYLLYLRVAYTAIKTADPNARVVSFTASQDYGGNVFPYLKECFDKGGLNYADVVTFHPYVARMDWSQPISQDSFNYGIRALMNQYPGGGNKGLWCGELYHIGKSVPGIDDNYTGRSLQGHEFARRYLMDLGTGMGRSFTVHDLHYVKLFHPTSTTAVNHRTGGMIPSSAFVIYNTLAKFFEGAKRQGEVNIGGKAKLYHFTKPGDVPIASAWSFDDNNAPSQLVIPNAATKIKGLDIMGNDSDQVQISGSNLILTLTNSPIYLQPIGAITSTEFRSLLEGAGKPTGYIRRQIWPGVTGGSIASIPVNTTPTFDDLLPQLEGFSDWADTYGLRLKGYIHPPTTGTYTFWVAGDDNAELWISSDSNPANKTRRAYTSIWTNSREWNKNATQKSAGITLNAGQRYYVEVLQKEDAGGDNVAVGWAKPGQGTTTPSEVVPGNVLSPAQ